MYPCRYCSKEFRDTSNRKNHENGVHLIRTRDFVCEQCGRDYKTKTDLRWHVRSVHEKFVAKKDRRIPSQCDVIALIAISH